MGGVVGLSGDLQHPAHLRGIGHLARPTIAALCWWKSSIAGGVGPDLATHATPKYRRQPTHPSRPVIVQGVGGVHHPRPHRHRGSGVAIATSDRWCLRPGPGIPPVSAAPARPVRYASMRLRNRAVCRTAWRRGAFLRTQQVGVRQRIDIVVDLVEPGRGGSGQTGPIRAWRCAARDTSKNDEER